MNEVSAAQCCRHVSLHAGGVDLYTMMQFVDVNTCKPVANLYAEIWHCNATGVYSGVVANGNGNTSDESNLDATFLRGLSPTDADGIVSFQTIFPGELCIYCLQAILHACSCKSFETMPVAACVGCEHVRACNATHLHRMPQECMWHACMQCMHVHSVQCAVAHTLVRLHQCMSACAVQCA